MPEDRLSLVLKRPVVIGGIEQPSLELAEPNAADLEAASGTVNWATNNFVLLGRMTGWPREVLEKLPASDFAKAGEFIARFTRPAQLGFAAMPDEFELQLSRPLKLGDREIAELSLREPTALEVEKMADEPNWAAQYLGLLARQTKIPRLQLGLIAGSDLVRAGEYFDFFLRPGQLTSAGPSPSSPSPAAGDPGTPGVSA